MKINSKLAVFLLTLNGLLATVRTDAAEPKFESVLKRADDKIEVRTMDNATTFSIRSPFGISNAVISREADDWPERVILRLHLKGLEDLRISNGKIELASESSGPHKKRCLQNVKNEVEGSTLESTKRFENEIRMIGSDGKPSSQIPLESGYFEVLLPKVLMENKPKSISVSWIDFYR